MAIDTYMVITDGQGQVLAGEAQTTVYDPYSKKNVANPIEIAEWDGSTENTVTIGSTGGGGTGTGKVVFNPFTIVKSVDKTSQALFIAQAKGTLLKSVDLLLVKSSPDGGPAAKPFLAYRLGTVGVSEIATSHDEESPREQISFVFGQFQIGYTVQKPDGTYANFAPVGWDRVTNTQI